MNYKKIVLSILFGLCYPFSVNAEVVSPDVEIVGGGATGNSNGTVAVIQEDSVKDKHLAFRNQAVQEDTMIEYKIQEQVSPYQIFAGSIIPGVLITGMNSDLPGNVVGQVSQNVYDSISGKYLLIPQGSKLIGIYDSGTDFAQTRGAVIWNRLIFPNGKSIVLPNFDGSDRYGYSGFKDKKRSHYARVVWSALLGALAVGGIESAGNSAEGKNVFIEKSTDSASDKIGGVIDKIVEKNMDIPPTIIIRPGYKFNIMVMKDIVLEPYVD